MSLGLRRLLPQKDDMSGILICETQFLSEPILILLDTRVSLLISIIIVAAVIVATAFSLYWGSSEGYVHLVACLYGNYGFRPTPTKSLNMKPQAQV